MPSTVPVPARYPSKACLRGELRLTCDRRGRLLKAQYWRDGRQLGPTLETDPDRHAGEYRRRGDSHMDSYGGGRACLFTAWSDGPASSGTMPYRKWVNDCLAQLAHLGVEHLWVEADHALERRRWKHAAELYDQVLRHWRGYGGGWAFNASQRRSQYRLALRVLRALALAQVPTGASARRELVAVLGEAWTVRPRGGADPRPARMASGPAVRAP